MLTARAQMIRTFRGDIAPYWRLFAAAYAARTVAVIAVVAAPWPLKLLIDHVLVGRTPRAIAGVPLTAAPSVLAAALTGGFLLIAIVGLLMNALEKNISALA